MHMKMKALKLISDEFKFDRDKGGYPYTDHLLRVKCKVSNLNDNEIEIIALLHDLVEDKEHWTIDKVKEEFNERIAVAVDCLTRREDEVYEDFIIRASKNKDAIIVKIADLEDNMDVRRLKALKEKDLKRLQKYHRNYNFLIDIFESEYK